MKDTAAQYVARRAPKLYPWGDNDSARAWDDADDDTTPGDTEAARLLALAALIDAAEPEHEQEYQRSDAMRAFDSLLSSAADAAESWRTRRHYRTWIDDTARDVAQEIADEHDSYDEPLDLDRIDYNGTVTEAVDGATPVYYSEIRLVFNESDAEIDSETAELAGDDADHDKLMQVAVYQALESATWEALREIAEERNEEREGYEWDADELTDTLWHTREQYADDPAMLEAIGYYQERRDL